MSNYQGFDPNRGQGQYSQQGPGYDPRYGGQNYPQQGNPQDAYNQGYQQGLNQGRRGGYPQYRSGGNSCLAQAIGFLACAECMNGCDFLSLLAIFKIAAGTMRSTSRIESAPGRSRAARAARRAIRSYQVNVADKRDHTVCKSYPSCSAYGMEAVDTHGALRGARLTAKRLWRCGHGQTGADPVPSR